MFLALGEVHSRRALEVNGRVEVFQRRVGMLTGHLTWAFLDLKRSMSSWQAFSKEEALREVKVMRILAIEITLLDPAALYDQEPWSEQAQELDTWL
jgi:hypothetical protein